MIFSKLLENLVYHNKYADFFFIYQWHV